MFSKRNNPDYLNWLAVGQAITVLSGGLRQYAETKMKDFQSLMTTKLGGIQCHCSVIPGKKPNLHESPKTSCTWANELRKSHCAKKHNYIPWHQSDSSKWHDPNDGYWEIAKIFMSDLGSGIINITSPSSIDATGLLNLTYYCKHFKIQKPLIKAVRDWRNKWAHAPDQLLQVSDKESAFDEILNLLDDPELMLCKEVQDCRKEIEEVRTSDTLILQKDELRILEEHMKIKDHQTNRKESNERKNVDKRLKKLENFMMPKGSCKIEKQDQPCTWNDVVVDGIIIFIGFFLGLLKNLSSSFRWFLLMLIVLQVGDKSRLFSDTGCFRATIKSPISNLRFQEFNFSSYLNYKRSDFFGRKWIFRELENVFESAGRGPPGVMIIGEPGFGKSAIMSELICSPLSSLLIHNNIIGYHLCDYSEKGKRNGARFVRNLVDQIASSIPEYSNHVSKNEQIHKILNDRCESDPIGCFHGTIVGPLRELKNQPGSFRYIIIDALDECIENDGETSEIIEIVSNKMSFFPTWLKVILSSRNWTAVTHKIPRSVKRIALDPADERNLEDIHFYIKQFLVKNSFFVDRLLEALAFRSTTEGIISLNNELSKKGGGNFLFIKTTLHYLNESEGRINLQSFPTSLYDTYDIYFKRHFEKEDFSRFKTLFEVLIAANNPLRLSDIDAILKAHNESSKAYDLIKKVSGILRFGLDETVLIYHQSFAEWLQEKEIDNGKLNISKARGHENIADHLFKKGNLPDLKTLSELAFHMLESGVAEKYAKKLEFMNVSTIQDPDTYNSILHELALNDKFAPILDIFIQIFHSVDIPNINKLTPAMFAASKGNVENLKVFIKNGADVNYAMEIPQNLYSLKLTINLWRLKNFSMIHLASYLGHTKTVELLLKLNASCTIASGYGLRPIHLAAENGHVDIIKILYTAGAKADVIALHRAATNNHFNVVSLLLKMDVRDECLPCKTCSLPEFQHGFYVEKVHILFRETALHAAVSRRHTKIVKLLLSYENSTLECHHCSGRTVLMDTVERNDIEIAELLLNAGANTETVCDHKLEKWFFENKFLIANSLERSYYTFLSDNRYNCSCGETAMHFCGKYGSWEMAELILKKNSNIFARNCERLLPVDFAILNDHVDFVHNYNLTIMEKNKYLVNAAFVRQASMCDSDKTLELLFTNIHKNNFSFVDENGTSLLHYAVGWSPYPHFSLPELKMCLVDISSKDVIQVKRQFTKRLTTVKLLVESQKDRILFVNRKNKEGKTALHYAARSGFVDALKYLVHHAHGDWKTRDHDGNTPLTLALEASPEQPNRFLGCFRTYDKLFRLCNTTTYDSTVEYLVWLQKSKFKKCDLESANILATAVKRKMPLTLYTLLKLGLDLNCKVSQSQRAFLMHLHVGGQQVSEVFKMFNINVTVKCNVPLSESELHLISRSLVSGDVGNFFKRSVNNQSFPFQRLVFSQSKGIRIFDECRDQIGHLAIHRAVESGNSDAVEWLINVGVDTSLKTRSGLTALDLSIFYLKYDLRRSSQKVMHTIRSLIFEKLLAESLKAIEYDWYSSWCNPKLNNLSPLHIAATKGIDTLSFVYNTALKFVPDLSLDCYNNDGVGPLYLAYFYESVDYNFFINLTTFVQLAEDKINSNKVSLQYPDREVEYQIIYNRLYKSPIYFPLNSVNFRPHVDEITNCPNFYSLIPSKKTLEDRSYQCITSQNLVKSDVLKVFPFHLQIEYMNYRSSFDYNFLAVYWVLSTMEMYWLKYHLGKKGSFLLWLRVREELERLKNCYCVNIMLTLQIQVYNLQNVVVIDGFTWTRMGWDKNSTLDDQKYRWPFYFLFKEAMGEYKSNEYLNVLNEGLNLDKYYYSGLYYSYEGNIYANDGTFFLR